MLELVSAAEALSTDTGGTNRRHRSIQNRVSKGQLSWEGADLTASFHIGHVDNKTTQEDIKAMVEKQGVDVIDLEEQQRRDKLYKSFKGRLKS